MFPKIHILYIFIYRYTKAFLLHLIKAWERPSKKKKKRGRDGEIGEHKLNEKEALNMKQKKWNKLDKSKRSSYTSVFLHTAAH